MGNLGLALTQTQQKVKNGAIKQPHNPIRLVWKQNKNSLIIVFEISQHHKKSNLNSSHVVIWQTAKKTKNFS